ncbi:hypothetical protein [Dictyobacter arantiisoli]|uniref:Uncharacterized protein n=1 Tax=Dictyobacter arantiisoli TaxID=2014874 RepID=A0A5A5T7Y1_9CHLR|nr:hypothetical protein [Dictyobacter arantiisoli]GCF07054.1 hypothetical protein KDI_06180 [Dictyobacter arantiisoli]
MGQYRQWLLYRETDLQLQTQIAACERELSQLQAQIDQLEEDTSYPENIILQTLIGFQHTQQASSVHAAAAAAAATYAQTAATAHNHTAATQSSEGTVSPALQAWSNLPNFDSRTMPEPPANPIMQNAQLQPQPQPDNLLPTDISAFMKDHAQTDPQLKVPWWLRNMRNDPANKEQQPQQTSPNDAQSTRTNRLVQRWFERWGEAPPATTHEQEKQA